MKTLLLHLKVTTPDDMPEDEVLRAVNAMIDVGFADAKDTAEDPSMDDEARAEASRVTSCAFHIPELASAVVPTPPEANQ